MIHMVGASVEEALMEANPLLLRLSSSPMSLTGAPAKESPEYQWM